MSDSKTSSGLKKLIDKSVIHIQKGKVKKAIKELYKVLEVEPWNIDVAYQVAGLYQRLNERINSISTFQNNLVFLKKKKSEIDPQEYSRAKILIYQAILSLDPVDIDIRIKLAHHYLMQKNKQKAAYLELQITLGQCIVIKDNSLTEYVTDLMKKIDLTEFEKEILVAEYYHNIKDENKYQECFTQLIEKYSSKIKYLKVLYEKHLGFYQTDEVIIKQYSLLLLQQKEYRQANSLLRKALTCFPNNTFYMELLSITAVKLNFLEEALDIFSKLKVVYSDQNEQKKIDLVNKNIELINKKIEEKSFPNEMPPTPDEIKTPEKKIATHDYLEDLKTVIEKSYFDDINNKNMSDKKTLVDDNNEISADLRELLTGKFHNPTDIIHSINKIDSPQQEKIYFEEMAKEVINFSNAQKIDFELSIKKLDEKKMMSDFFARSKEIIKNDYRACLDLAIATHIMGFNEISTSLFKMALNLNPKKEKAIVALINDWSSKKTKKAA